MQWEKFISQAGYGSKNFEITIFDILTKFLKFRWHFNRVFDVQMEKI
jgi:hypothetical protein